MGYLNKDQGEEVAAIYTKRGDVARPAFSFQVAPGSGMFLQGDAQIAFSVDGVEVLVLGSGGLLFDDGTAAAPSISFDADTDSGFFRIGANDVGLTLNGASLGTVVGTTGTQTLSAKTFVAPILGVATGTSLAVTGLLSSSSPSAGIGYATGAGGAVTQGAGRTTGVTVNAISGAITTDTASLAAEADATFVVTNSSVAIGDVIVLSQRSGSNGGNTAIEVGAVAAGSFSIDVVNNNAAAGTAETGAIIINFAVIKAVSA